MAAEEMSAEERYEWENARPHISEELNASECWSLLRGRSTGRVAFLDDGRVLVFPVNYVVHDQAVYFRTAENGFLGATPAVPRNASFQIDHHDSEQMAGWSVLISGQAGRVSDEQLLTQLWGRRMAEPWGGGHRDVFVGITPEAITGRRVGRS